jgi:hypothetical protein
VASAKPTRVPSPFATLVSTAIANFGGLKKDFATAVGLPPTRLSAILADTYHEPSIELCLRIAQVGRVRPEVVLRAAGRPEVAEVLADLFPEAIEPGGLNTFERRLLTLTRGLSAGQGQAVLVLVRAALNVGFAKPTTVASSSSTQRRRR